ncbi:helix-turn-helix transcriptional regulator [Marinicellulosiphila megalodicopiae]|uniref:helix-turn-helix transcriptional regulator n=1 Tax=Marinicellulosiphila megalodicopiae TaxID=2724896 RepID=UPI003BB04F1F
MKKLIKTVNRMLTQNNRRALPFSVYTSVHEQNLLNVPIAKPLLIFVLCGNKQLGKQNELNCYSGQFVFLSDSPAINMRNIPENKEYFALLIEFEYEDFQDIPNNQEPDMEYFVGDTNVELEQCLQQFVLCSTWAPDLIIHSRKKEILTMMHHMGYTQVISMMRKPRVSHKIHDLFIANEFQTITTDFICDQLNVSESTLRRKLKNENTSVSEIKDRAKMGLGLHLLQTTNIGIGLIAQQCGYQSQSRFTDRFKKHFSLTPSELRKTKLKV